MAAFTITHQGVPIGSIETDGSQERIATPVVPLPRYEAI